VDDLIYKIPNLVYLQRIADQDYFPELFSSIELKQSIPNLNSLKAFKNTILLRTFPGISNHLIKITYVNINKNFSDRRVIQNLLDMSLDQMNLKSEYIHFFFERFANTLANYACLNLEMEGIFRKNKINIFRTDISTKMLDCVNDFNISTSFFMKIAESFCQNNKSTDFQKIILFIESSFFFVFPITYFCFKYRKNNSPVDYVEDFYFNSINFMLYICNITRSIIRQIKKYNEKQNINFSNKSASLTSSELKKQIHRLNQIHENSSGLIKVLKDTLTLHKKYYDDLDLDPHALILHKNIKSLESLLK
jgi:hypothetical protein